MKTTLEMDKIQISIIILMVGLVTAWCQLAPTVDYFFGKASRLDAVMGDIISIPLCGIMYLLCRQLDNVSRKIEVIEEEEAERLARRLERRCSKKNAA